MMKVAPIAAIAAACLFCTPYAMGDDSHATNGPEYKPAISGYADYEAMRGQLEQIAADTDVASLRSLGKTLGGREVFLLSLTRGGKAEDKPAILVVGSVHAPHLLGSELAIRMARQIAEKAKTDEATRKLLEANAFYFIPRPNPDAAEYFFRRPAYERTANERETDDDRDGDANEDGPDDLNGDGFITMMRVEDPAGKYIPHPDDPRVMIEADPKKGERGRYSLYVEGRDDDGDEEFNEDGPGGVDFNRNFTFKYPYFKPGAGPHQVSEIETRAVADFAYSRPNIAAVFSFGPHDNLMHPWKPNRDAERSRYKTTLLSDDAPYADRLAEKYREILGAKNPPENAGQDGAFAPWAYSHYGRWSLAARGWWVPETKKEEKKEAADDKEKENSSESKEETAKKNDDGATKPEGDGVKKEPTESAEPAEKKDEKEKKGPSEKKPAEDKRGADHINALRWFEEKNIDGFVDWSPIEHPDFPGKKVEVGGFKPYVLLNPPADEFESLAEKHGKFLVELAGSLPRLELSNVEVKKLGEGVYRVTAQVANDGFLPTESKMGVESKWSYPVQLAIELPEGTRLATGHPRTELPPLAGKGGNFKKEWVVVGGDVKTGTAKIKTWSPTAGREEKSVELK